MNRLVKVLLATVLPAASLGALPVEVRVADMDGHHLIGVHLSIRQPGTRFARRYMASTDQQGVARFQLPPGRFNVDCRVPSGLVDPSDNPYTVPPSFTIRPDDTRTLTVDLVLQRGWPVEVILEGATEPGDPAPVGFTVELRHRPSGHLVVGAFRGSNRSVRTLPPGLWEVTIRPRPGFLLNGVSRDGTSIAGSAAAIDLKERPATVTFTYRRPATVYGAVVDPRGEPGRVEVVADLLEPGPWRAAADDRGGSVYQRVGCRPEKNGDYRMVIPDGRWRVRPEAEALIFSNPEELILDVGPGEDVRADFAVDLVRQPRTFTVVVEGDLDDRVAGAHVEISALDRPREVLRSGVSTGRGRLSFPILEEGDYLLVAGHPRYLETRRELRAFDALGSVFTSIALRTGATVRLQARDAAGEPLAGVRLLVDRRDELPPLLLDLPSLRAAKEHARAVTDVTGRAEVHGLYPGLHQVRALLGRHGGTNAELVFGRRDDRRVRVLDVDLDSGETVDVEAWDIPSASVDVRPEVASGQPLPPAVLEVRVLGEDGGELGPPPAVTERDGVYEVRGLPVGKALLDMVLSHPCLLPYPALRWQVELDLERGGWVEVAPVVEAVRIPCRVETPDQTSSNSSAASSASAASAMR